jgi:hypothetical protein
MNKLALATAISVIFVPAAFADDVRHFTLDMSSGTLENPLASFVNTAASTVNIAYVDPASGAASNSSAPAIQLTRPSEWTFDFTNPAAVSFTGALYLGDYRVQTALPPVGVDGRQSFTGVVQSFAGTGAFDEATNTFTYQFYNAVRAGGGGSVYSAAATAKCQDGRTSALGKVCQHYAVATPAWEGLALSFVFAEDKSSFTGSLQGRDTSGSGITNLSSLINWHVWEDPVVLGGSAVPVPASAWLFGSGLLGLFAGTRRQHRRS